MTSAIALGEHASLTIVEQVDGGVLLGAGDLELFLPAHLTPAGAATGETIDVFIYADGDGAPQATTRTPAALVGEAAYLECVTVTSAGAYLAWGVPKDLYVPRSESEGRLVEGQRYVAVVTLDAHGERLIASTRVARHLDYDVEHIAVDQEVDVLVYGEIEAGVQVVVDRRHRGLVHRTKMHQALPIGSTHRGYVRNVRQDNRLDIELTRRGADGSADAQAIVLEALERAGGSLPLHDKSPPEAISAAVGLSKKAFKRAVGGLYKQRRIVIEPDGIRLVE